jgi:hypothetical protein
MKEEINPEDAHGILAGLTWSESGVLIRLRSSRSKVDWKRADEIPTPLTCPSYIEFI